MVSIIEAKVLEIGYANKLLTLSIDNYNQTTRVLLKRIIRQSIMIQFCLSFAGRGLGSFLGGYFNVWFGSRRAFRMFSYISIGGLILHLVSHHFYLKKIAQRRGR